MLPVSFPPRLLHVSYIILVFLQRAEHLKEIRKLAKQAVAKRIGKRVVKYKNRLRKNLPSQIKIWSEREKRLLAVITGSAGVPIDALLMRECPDPPAEVDPDTDEDETKTDDQTDTLPEGKLDDECDEDDPTTRPWTCKQQGLHRPRSRFVTLTPSLHPHSFCGRVRDISETAYTPASTGYGNESILLQGKSVVFV